MTKAELAKTIEHTNLNPVISRQQVVELVNAAKDFSFRSVCITPGWVYFAKGLLAGTDIKVVSVPNWAPGGGPLNVKGEMVFTEADEVDYIIDVYMFAGSKNWNFTTDELARVRKATKVPLKIIIESTVIREFATKSGVDYEVLIKEICRQVETCGADYIKTDSGLFTRRGGFDQLKEDVGLLLDNCKLPVKASAGIRTTQEATALLEMGASLLGTSKGIDIIKGYNENSNSAV